MLWHLSTSVLLCVHPLPATLLLLLLLLWLLLLLLLTMAGSLLTATVRAECCVRGHLRSCMFGAECWTRDCRSYCCCSNCNSTNWWPAAYEQNTRLPILFRNPDARIICDDIRQLVDNAVVLREQGNGEWARACCCCYCCCTTTL